MKILSFFLFFTILVTAGMVVMGADDSAPLSAGELLSKELKPKEAIVWYLYHSGWAVKTENHLLIFDYIENGRPKKPAQPSLNNGFIEPEEIKGQQTAVFVSHDHGDHYDPVILGWAKTVKNIHYIFGWQALDDPAHYYFSEKRQKLETGGMVVYNIHHRFDGIPESAFLVMVDGLEIYFAGDHGSSSEEKNLIFKGNIDYLLEVAGRVDLMFIPTFGGEYYTIDTLNPRFVFPMHDGGREHQYLKFANIAVKRGIHSPIIAVARPGDHVYYTKGKIKEISKLEKRKSKE